MNSFDALLVVSFGGPEKHEDVLPFLENVVRGKNVPRERMLEVAQHYYHFDGRSPINDQNKQLIAALEGECRSKGIAVPVYWGNRNWHPLLPDTLKKMHAEGIRRAAAFVTSPFGSYSGCRQYREVIEAMTDRVRAAMAELPQAEHSSDDHPPAERSEAGHSNAEQLIFTAHSI